MDNFTEAKKLVGLRTSYTPRAQYHDMYNRNFKVFTQLYEKNKELFKLLNY